MTFRARLRRARVKQRARLRRAFDRGVRELRRLGDRGTRPGVMAWFDGSWVAYDDTGHLRGFGRWREHLIKIKMQALARWAIGEADRALVAKLLQQAPLMPIDRE